MELKSMKLTPKEQKEESGQLAMDKPQYPWGLELRLNSDAIDHLAIPALPQVGASMMVMARVLVTSISQNANENGKDQSICLQVTDMALGPDQGEKTPAEQKLYKS